MFITVLTSARHLSLSLANSIQSPQPLPTSWRSILILSSHLHLCLPNGLFPSGFPTKTLCTPLTSSTRATCPAHLILLNFITCTVLGGEYRSLSSSLCNFPHSPVTPSLWGPNIFLDTLFSNTLRLCSSLNVSDQVSYHRIASYQRHLELRPKASKLYKKIIIWLVASVGARIFTWQPAGQAWLKLGQQDRQVISWTKQYWKEIFNFSSKVCCQETKTSLPVVVTRSGSL